MMAIDARIVGALVAAGALLLAYLVLIFLFLKGEADYYEGNTDELPTEVRSLNPPTRRGTRATAATATHVPASGADTPHTNSHEYTRLLGKEVEAKVYAASNWERMVVVAVSWRGAVCVRPVRDMKTKGRWIPKDIVAERVREVRRTVY